MRSPTRAKSGVSSRAQLGVYERRRTRLMEIVANAKGSPTMLPKLNLELLRYSTMLSYFFKDGECRDPYGGMKNSRSGVFDPRSSTETPILEVDEEYRGMQLP